MYHDDPSRPRQGPVVGRPEVLRARPDLGAIWAEANEAFSVRITRSWWNRIDLSDPSDPLALQALPHPEELNEYEGDLDDPVGDATRSPVPWVVHKYPSRVLLLMTKRCHLYCRYCFRRNHHPSERQDPTPEEWETAMVYALDSGAEEVILSGGDPLAVRDSRLFETIDRLRPAIPVVRVHTRAPITRPDRVTEDLVRGLAARAPVWLVVHCNHPREISDEVASALERLVNAGVPVLNQAVLLRGVNDSVDTLVELCQSLVRLGVFPYYLHHTDAARGNGHLRVGMDEGRRLWDELQGRVSGVALPRYVVDPPDGSGKRDVGPAGAK